MDELYNEVMGMFEDFKYMDMDAAGANPFFLESATYLGYVDECERESDGKYSPYRSNKEMLDDVVTEAINWRGSECSIRDACLAAEVDPNSLDEADIEYIREEFRRRNR